jgi:L-iditol 2-dehydrogenase
MKAVRCNHGKVFVTEVPAPSGEGVKVKIASAGICGSDLHLLASGWPLPNTLGHELAGITPNGRAVAIEPVVPCGHCEFCREGTYHLCVKGQAAIVFGVGLDGGMAEYITVPERCLVPLPGGIDVKDACLAEPMAVAIHGVVMADPKPNSRVLVIGGGSIGLAAVAAAQEVTPHVHLVARHDAQKAAGERLGAKLGADGGTYDLTIDCAGSTESITEAAKLCRPRGTMLLLTNYWGGVQMPSFDIVGKDLRVIGSSMYCQHGVIRDIDAAVAIMAKRSVIAEALITHRMPLDAAPDAFAIAGNRAAGAIKVTLNP